MSVQRAAHSYVRCCSCLAQGDIQYRHRVALLLAFGVQAQEIDLSIQGLVTFVHRTMRQRGADAAAGVSVEPEAAALRRAHLESALTALRLLIEGNPRLAALMASRPALAPLLDCVEPSCRWELRPARGLQLEMGRQARTAQVDDLHQ